MKKIEVQTQSNIHGLTSTQATVTQRRIVIVTGTTLALIVLFAFPFVHQDLVHVPAFISFYTAFAIFADFITSYLLFGQFQSTRAPMLAVLSATYFFSSLIIVPYTLTFPGMFSLTGLFNASLQTANWLWIFWHTGFPLGIILYVIVDARYKKVQLPPHQARRLSVLLLFGTLLLLVALSILAVVSSRFLPILIVHGDYQRMNTTGIGPAVLVISIVACGAVACQLRHGTVIQAWLCVAAFAWLFDVILNLLSGSRFSLGWYLARANSMIAVTVVLCSLLHEVSRLYGKITQQNEQLEQQNEQGKELDRLKTSFFANVSHELRTPLTLILGPIKNLLTQETLMSQHYRTLQIVERNTDLLLRRVNDLLDVAKLEAGKMELTYTRADLVQIVQWNAAYFEALAEQRQIMVSIEAPLSIPAAVDQEKVERVFFNLFSNAFKFTPSGGRISCFVSSEHGLGSITIQDTGPGIRPELRQQIFKRFQQGNAGPAKQVGGTGLGLSIVKEFVELHGGTVEVDEAPGGGARFLLHIPLVAPPGTTVHQSLREISPPISTSSILPKASSDEEKELREAALAASEKDDTLANILVIEDNQDMASYIASILVPSYRVTLASDGQDGLEKALKYPPDLVLCDVMMPRMNGEEFLTAFRQHAAFDPVPVMLLSARTDDALRVRLLRMGGQDYLVKPFLPEEVLVRAANLIIMKRVREVLQQGITHQHHDLVSLANEVAQRKREGEQMLEALRQSEHNFRQLADTMPQIVWTSHSDGWYDYFNQQWFDYTGMSLAQAQGWGWKAILHSDDVQRSIDAWKSSLQTGEVYEIENRFQRASDGSYRWHLGRALPVRDADGKIIKWFGTYTDIDDQKQNEEALRESEHRKDLFLSMISHELKTPLTSLQIFIEILHEECDASGQQSMSTLLAQIEAQTQRLHKLIDNLLDISRVQMGKLVLNETWFNMDVFIQEIVSTIQPGHPRHPISVSGNVFRQVYADKDRMGQVLINLLSNAIKYSPQGAPVQVSAVADQEMVTITVHDEGIGIPKKHQIHIFERFYRVYSDQDRKFPGLGIGLYIAAEVIQRHGGQIWVEDTEDVGSTFRFSLPFSRMNAGEEAGDSHIEAKMGVYLP
jgi:PAS domain S-box-containing protein